MPTTGSTREELSGAAELAPGTLVRVQAKDFRSLRYVDVTVPAFAILVGPNASGKSNFLDVLAFLRDVVEGGLEAAFEGDARLDIAFRASDPRQLVWMQRARRFELAIEASIPEQLRTVTSGGPGPRICRYELRIDVGERPRIEVENLYLQSEAPREPPQRDLFPDSPLPPDGIVLEARRHTPGGSKPVVRRASDPERVLFHAERTRWQNPFRLRADRSALASLPEDEERFPVALWFRKWLREDVRRIQLASSAMRLPSPPTRKGPYRPDGSNLPWVVDELVSTDRERFGWWLDHVREALPDIETITTRERPEDRHRYLVVGYRSGLEAPSWTVSDGTLRFLALSLLAYARTTGLVMIEEPENGIHPRAIGHLYQSLSSVYDAQILVATHSPVLLAEAEPAQLLCFARTDEGATDIVGGDRHPRLREWRSALDLGTLLATGLLG